MSEHKKTALLWILQALWQHSDERNPMTQEDLIGILREKHGLELDRRAVSRNLALLREADVDVRSDGRGSWIDPGSKPFSEDELRLLVKFIRECSFLTAKDSEDLIDRLCALSGDAFRRSADIKVKSSVKTKSRMFYLNLEKIERAIRTGRKISFSYHVFAPNGDPFTAKFVVRPLRTEFVGRNCCVLTDDETCGPYRIERMSKIQFI